MTDMVKFIQLSGLDVDLGELADLTGTFKTRGVSIQTAQKMAVDAKIAELEADELEIDEAIKKAMPHE